MALTFDDEKMEIYPTLHDLEAAVFEILNAITNALQVRLCITSTTTRKWQLYVLHTRESYIHNVDHMLILSTIL